MFQWVRKMWNEGMGRGVGLVGEELLDHG
ncbi:hypothetical protein DESC_40118 [Desulfosarcina cetonica]|nr:hypothetical protein DESC_40118 [Desulfosarcina cetonica]